MHEMFKQQNDFEIHVYYYHLNIQQIVSVQSYGFVFLTNSLSTILKEILDGILCMHIFCFRKTY